MTTTSLGQEAAFWRGTNDDLWEAWYTHSPWSAPVDWTAQWVGAARLASAPAVAVTPSWQTLVFWQGTNNDLWQAWYTPGLGWEWSGGLDRAMGGVI